MSHGVFFGNGGVGVEKQPGRGVFVGGQHRDRVVHAFALQAIKR
jgi:hypothetical protein